MDGQPQPPLGAAVRPDSEETRRLLQAVRDGDRQALSQLLAQHRDALRLAVELRLDARLQSRFDASDVVQEAQLEATRRIDDYLARRPMPFHLWLRKTAHESLLRLRRQHAEADCRAVEREVPLPDGSSAMLARELLGLSATPSQQAAEQELAARLRQAVAALAEADREVLLLRHFEGLGNQEVAQLLELEPEAARKRYGRALLRLRKLLSTETTGPEP
jgi:RNA polymerase sigma-70 factor (ECF subfamily)